MSASETVCFARASIDMLGDLIPNDEPFWKSWCAHVAYYKVMLSQHTFTRDDVSRLDEMIIEHQHLFKQVFIICSVYISHQ